MLSPMSPDVCVLTPIRGEGGRVLETLPILWRAAQSADATLHLLVAVDAPEALLAARSFAVAHDAVSVHALQTTGKWPALRFGAAASDAAVMVLIDADVRPWPDAILRVAAPVLDGRADACGARIDAPASLADTTPIARLINRWEQYNCAAWHRLRSSCPDARWCVPGGLYAVRRDLFPTAQILVPLLDDASVGVHLLERGARFAYEPLSRLEHASSPGYGPWIARKIRHRRGWVALGTHRPGLVAEMRARLLGALDDVIDRRDVSGQLLRVHHHAFWRAAALAERARPSTTDSW